MADNIQPDPNPASAKDHAIDKNADDGRVQPKNIDKYTPSGGEKTYGYGSGKKGPS